MKFRCYPWKTNIYLVYSSYGLFRTAFFDQLKIQQSPKQSLPTRIMRSFFGFFLSTFSRIQLDVPVSDASYIGIVKGTKVILFEWSKKDGVPLYVWRKGADGTWQKESFLGYPLIGAYTLAEFKKKQGLIKRALNEHWQRLQKTPPAIHGDLSHFNILVSPDRQLIFIDEKPVENTRIFDLFYFHAYYTQCLTRCQTLSETNRLVIRKELKQLLQQVLENESEEVLHKELDEMIIPESNGLIKAQEKFYLEEFRTIFAKA